MDELAPLGAAVRRARQAEGLTLRALSERSGLSSRFLSDLEHGKGNISIGRLLQVGRALNVRVSELVSSLDAPPPRAPVLSLVGLRGAGKSTAGKLAAERAGIDFVELDERIEAAAGLPLSQIFEIHGEAYYRRLEREVLVHLLETATSGLVLATGGGIVTSPETWSLLKLRTRTVWLEADPEAHYQRVMDQGDLRPMENRPSAMAELRALLTARAPLYAESETRLHTGALGLEGTVAALRHQLDLCEHCHPEA